MMKYFLFILVTMMVVTITSSIDIGIDEIAERDLKAKKNKDKVLNEDGPSKGGGDKPGKKTKGKSKGKSKGKGKGKGKSKDDEPEGKGSSPGGPGKGSPDTPDKARARA